MEAQKRWYAETLPLAGAVIVDVGANVGELSEFFFHALQGQGSLLSVEPLAENVAQIEQRIVRLQAADRWRVLQCAVSAQEGEVTLRLGSAEGTPHNSMVVTTPSAFDSASGSAAANYLRVPSGTLSTLCPSATVVKLDIEGHEYQVLAESLAKLPSVKAWAVELHLVPGYSLLTTIQTFRNAGFTVFGAGQKRGDRSGRWMSVEVPAGMDWDSVPVAQKRADGSEFKMLHVIAIRS